MARRLETGIIRYLAIVSLLRQTFQKTDLVNLGNESGAQRGRSGSVSHATPLNTEGPHLPSRFCLCVQILTSNDKALLD